jgi:hypothetical protein
MLPEFIDLKTIYLVAHVFGAILGAGGAFASDAMFFSTIKDGRITADELRFMKLGSKLVWTGLAILVLSGLFLVSTDMERYLSSTKFLAKVTIVCIIVVNGIIFHLIHLPHIRGHLGIKFSESRTFMKKSSFLLVSGAVSMISWIFTVVLGVVSKTPFSYGQIFGVYLIFILCGALGALFMKRVLL